MSLKSTLGRKAATSVVRHTVHGTVSKARRDPVRASRLIGLGAVLGAVSGFLVGRRRGSAATPTPTVPVPSPVTSFPAPPAAVPSPPPEAVPGPTDVPRDEPAPGLDALGPIVPGDPEPP